jgi:myo-inositol-1-phosphate synthase
MEDNMETKHTKDKDNTSLFSNREYNHEYIHVTPDKLYQSKKDTYKFQVEQKSDERLGVLLVGWGGNNGSTLTAGIEAYKRRIKWRNKSGEHTVKFYGSISQYGSVHIGYNDNGEAHTELFSQMCDMYKPEDIIIGGWDICKYDIYTSAQKAGVIDPDLLDQIKEPLQSMMPMPSLYEPDFIATNQSIRANNVIQMCTKWDSLLRIVDDISRFRIKNDLNNVVVLWTASTERFHKGEWKSEEELMDAIRHNDHEISPSILFAVASVMTNSIFLNGSPQNTICSAVIDIARKYGSFLGGEDFKTGQTKLKSALADWLVSSGIRPLSIVSYNHLGNNDGKNLDESAQFRSKEITKKNVIDDVVNENPHLFESSRPDHAVVIKYIPAVGDSKRAMDEYFSELFLDGRHTLVIHNTCEDSLLATPLMLDLILFSEFFSRIRISKNNGEFRPMNSVLSMLSIFFKAPVINTGEPLVNAFFKQRNGLENFIRVLNGLPISDHIGLTFKV